MQANARFIDAELNWFSRAISSDDLSSLIPPMLPESGGSVYAAFIAKHKLSIEERFILILALAPHLRPEFLDGFFARNESGRHPSEIGGRIGKHHSGFLPTGETAVFLLGGRTLEGRLPLIGLFDQDSTLVREGILFLSDVENGEPKLSGVLCVPDEVIAHLLLGKKMAPKFSKDFPAQLLTTTKTWDDLVLNEQTARHLREIEVWLEFNHVLMNGWGLSRLIRPGFKALFHGAPGTGKSLTASLLGQRTGREVYRIDLSMIVSKYIGETEKNLARVFDRAENKEWILFFDEADALFGKRTAVSSSHDRYANQEVSYLLQRIEEFNGLVILASNLKSNMDDAFLRRFNSIIYYPSPRQEERYLIWKKGFSSSTQLEEQIRLEHIAQKYDLSGGHIVNVIHYCSLMAASRGDNTIRLADLTEGLRKEYAKLGRTI